MKRKALGDILMEMGVIDELQLSSALAHHRQWGVPLGRALVEKRLCGQDHIATALQRQTGLPLINLRTQKLSPDLVRVLSVKVAQQHRVVPIRTEGKRSETLVIAIAAPASLAALDAVQHVSGKQRVVAHLASDQDIGYGLAMVYGLDTELDAPAAPRFGFAARVENEHEFDGAADEVIETDAVEGTRANAEGRIAAAATPMKNNSERVNEKTAQPDGCPQASREPGRTDAPISTTARVLLFGWPLAAQAALKRFLVSSGLDVFEAAEPELSRAGHADVVLAPLPSVEATFARGIRITGKLVVAGKNPEEDLPRAQAIGACGFVPAPLEAEFVLHVVRRIQKRQAQQAEATA